MPKTYTTGASTKRTTHLTTVKTKSGSVDNRYTTQQYTKSDGTRDMRTSLKNYKVNGK